MVVHYQTNGKLVLVRMWRNWNSHTLLVSLIFPQPFLYKRHSGCHILVGLLPLIPSTLKIPFHWLLASTIADEKPTASLIVVPLQMNYLFSLAAATIIIIYYYYYYYYHQSLRFCSIKCLDVVFKINAYINFILTAWDSLCFFSVQILSSIFSGIFLFPYLFHATSPSFSLFSASGTLI